jgi:SAM-dependent methyltransferase
MDVGHTLLACSDLPLRAWRRLSGRRLDYRAFLFEDMQRRLGPGKPRRVLEIGPKEGDDTRRLVTLAPEKLVLVDLPVQRANVESWLPKLSGAPVEAVFGNIMYDREFETVEPFDIVWCTGVLYHNPEQLRFVRQLYDLTAPGGLLVIESATARRPGTRNANCVEIWHPEDKAASDRYHLSTNITHLPSRRAIESWLDMVGFSEIERSACHRRVLRSLSATRAAYIARRPADDRSGVYYSVAKLDYPIGRAR